MNIWLDNSNAFEEEYLRNSKYGRRNSIIVNRASVRAVHSVNHTLTFVDCYRRQLHTIRHIADRENVVDVGARIVIDLDTSQFQKIIIQQTYSLIKPTEHTLTAPSAAVSTPTSAKFKLLVLGCRPIANITTS
jgi:hypothetical protein